MANIKDVAKQAGVSVTTVSRVINNRGYIGKVTREKVEQAMRDMDYFPNQIARSLQNSQSNIIGVIIPDSSHPFFAELIQNIEIYANKKGYKVMICNSLGNIEKERQYLSMLRQNRVDGIIMCSHTLEVEEYKQLRLPIVSFDRQISESIPYVASDNYYGGELATKHLISRGCKNLLHISGSLELDMLPNRRADAFKIQSMNAGVKYHVVQGAKNELSFEYFSDFIEKEVSKYLDKVDGIFCSNDTVAYVLYHFALKKGIAIPDDLKIIGYDYTNFTKMIQVPKLTTIKQPINKMGEALCSTIIELIEDHYEGVCKHSVFDVELIQGETT